MSLCAITFIHLNPGCFSHCHKHVFTSVLASPSLMPRAQSKTMKMLRETVRLLSHFDVLYVLLTPDCGWENWPIWVPVKINAHLAFWIKRPFIFERVRLYRLILIHRRSMLQHEWIVSPPSVFDVVIASTFEESRELCPLWAVLLVQFDKQLIFLLFPWPIHHSRWKEGSPPLTALLRVPSFKARSHNVPLSGSMNLNELGNFDIFFWGKRTSLTAFLHGLLGLLLLHGLMKSDVR